MLPIWIFNKTVREKRKARYAKAFSYNILWLSGFLQLFIHKLFLFWDFLLACCIPFVTFTFLQHVSALEIGNICSRLKSANVFVFGDFNVHHKDWLTYSGGTDWPGELCYNFPISNDLTQVVNFPTRIPDSDSHSTALLDLFLSSDVVFVLQWLSLHWEILMMLLSQFPLTFQLIHNRTPHFIDWLMTILVLIEMVFVIISEMFHEKISLNLVLLLLVNFVSGFRLELMYISLIKNIRSSLIHLHGFQLFTFFVCTKEKNPLILRKISDKLVIVAKVFSKLPDLHILINKRVYYFPET